MIGMTRPWALVFAALLGVLLLGAPSIPVHSTGAPADLFRSPRGDAAAAPAEQGSIVINVSNTAPIPTGTFDEQIILESAAYSGLINSNFSNVRAVYAQNGSPIYMWVESNASNSAGATVLWLRLSSIPSHGSALVDLLCDAPDVFDLSQSGYTGEGPLLSSVYAEFDNGWRVFNFYDNFSADSLSSLWGNPPGWAYTSGDGFQLDSVPGSGENLGSIATFAYPAVVDFDGDLYLYSSASATIVEGLGDGACPTCGNAQAVGWDATTTQSGPAPYVADSSSAQEGGPVVDTPTFGVFTSEAINSTTAQFQFNYGAVVPPPSFSMPPSPQPIGLAMSGYFSADLSRTETTYWIRERAYVPGVSEWVVGVDYSKLTATIAAYPGWVPVNDSVTLVTTVGGWFGTVSYRYSGLPPGCATQDAPVLSCAPRHAGLFHPLVAVTDEAGGVATDQTNVTVASVYPPLPLAAYLIAAPANATVGVPFTLVAVVTGGVIPYRYVYAGLPADCATSDNATVTCVDNSTETLTITLNVTDARGEEVSAFAVVPLQPAPVLPLAVYLLLLPAQVPVNGTVTLFAPVSGGEPPYSFNYSGLPRYCANVNRSEITCATSEPGAYFIVLTVEDQRGFFASASGTFVVVAGSTPGGPPQSVAATALTSEQIEELFIGVVVAIVVSSGTAIALLLPPPRNRGPTPKRPNRRS